MAILLLTLDVAKAQINEKPVRKILTVLDFTGIPDEKEDYLARTFTVISLQYASPVNCPGKEKVRLKAETKISLGQRSWMKTDRIRSKDLLNELLSHEQGHYDIGYTFAIDLKQEINSNCLDKSRFKFQADSLFQSMNKRYDSLQRKYDVETEFMRNRKMQVKWKLKIAAMLDKTTLVNHRF